MTKYIKNAFISMLISQGIIIIFVSIAFLLFLMLGRFNFSVFVNADKLNSSQYTLFIVGIILLVILLMFSIVLRIIWLVNLFKYRNSIDKKSEASIYILIAIICGFIPFASIVTLLLTIIVFAKDKEFL